MNDYIVKTWTWIKIFNKFSKDQMSHPDPQSSITTAAITGGEQVIPNPQGTAKHKKTNITTNARKKDKQQQLHYK